ncbi:reverse transcriptase domain-containing protein [Tanacetum coccineum]
MEATIPLRLDELHGLQAKKRGLAPERNKAIQDDSGKFNGDAGILKEVLYNSWLSNPLMVKSADGNLAHVRWTSKILKQRMSQGLLSITGKLTGRSSPSVAEKSFTFFSKPLKIAQKGDFQWDTGSRGGPLSIMKNRSSIAELPTLTAQGKRGGINLLLSCKQKNSYQRMVLMKDREGRQIPVYFTKDRIQRPNIGNFIVERPEDESPVTNLWLNRKHYRSRGHCSQTARPASTAPGQDKKKARAVRRKAVRCFRPPDRWSPKQSKPDITSADMHMDARGKLVRECIGCQCTTDPSSPKNPQQNLTPITSPWPFYKWGIDIAGPFPEGPGEIISDNGKQFRDNPFKDWCEKLCIRQCFASVKQPASIGKIRLLDNDGNPLVPTGIMENDSEVVVVFDETANLRISTSGKDGSDKGYGTNSLLEQWKDSYPDNDDYDMHDDDMYENHNLPEHLQSICDDLDITVRGRKKKYIF